MNRIFRLVSILAACAVAQWNAPQVGSFGVATVREDIIAKKLRERFKASGTPVFLMGNPGAGLQQGDLIRFSDKAIFVDADVWQTLASEGALRSLKQAPVVRVKAGADPAAWTARSRLVPGASEKRLYEFGASLLKVLETAAGAPSDGQKLFLSFEGGQMVLTAPASFLDRLKSGSGEASAVKDRSVPRGRPRWVSRPPSDSLGRGSKVDWTPWAVDDSGGPTYAYRYRLDGQIPTGMSWNADHHRLEGVASQTGVWKMVLRVQDGNGAADSIPWRLVVTDAAPLRNLSDKDVDPVVAGLELPWDTLTESRWYRWNLAEQVPQWERQGVRLDSVAGEGAEASWDGRMFSLRARRSGTATIRFHFARRSGSSVLVKKCPVRAYPPPVFLSRLGGSSLVERSTRVYRPIARDAYGGLVAIEADLPFGAPFDWNGTDLRVSPIGPGSWSAKFTARDSLDHTTEQWVTFVSEARLSSRWSVETRWVAGTNPWMASAEFGRGRFSLFTPDPTRLTHPDDPVRQDWPFLMLGANLLGAESIRRGHAFSIDLGGTLRLPDAAILTGGVVGLIQGRVDCRPRLPWIFEGEFLGWVHQAILATDTVRLRTTLEAKNNPDDIEDFRLKYGRVLGSVMADAFDHHNAVFLTRLEGWLELPARLRLGVGLTREDMPVTMSMYQRASTGLRWVPAGRFGSLETTVRAAWGPGVAGAATSWDLRWSSGILP